MNAKHRFVLAVVVLGLLMTGPFVITAILIWASAQPAEQELLVQLIAPHLSLGIEPDQLPQAALKAE